MVGIGALAAYGSVRMRLKTAQAHKWPTVTGTIVSSELEAETERHDGKPIRMYGAAIRYAYEVDGKTYESDQIQLGGTSETSRPGEFERVVARYPEGKRVTVYYDPDGPATATLEPGALGGIFNMAMALGAGLKQTSTDRPTYRVELLFSFRGVKRVEVPEHRIRPA